MVGAITVTGVYALREELLTSSSPWASASLRG
jgi:hypothetical protein